MIDPEWNFIKLTTNYLYSKTIDSFLNKPNEIYNQVNLSLLNAIIKGLGSYKNEITSSIRFKLFTTYLLILNAQFIQDSNENTLNEIVKVLYNDYMVKTIPIDLLTKFKNIACKKICSLLASNSVIKYKESFKQLLDNQLIDPSDYLDFDSSYSNELIYDELKELIKQYLLNKSSSLIFTITNKFDLSNDQNEITLIDYIDSFKTKRSHSPVSVDLDDMRSTEAKKPKRSSIKITKLNSKDQEKAKIESESESENENDESSSKENTSPSSKQAPKSKVLKIKNLFGKLLNSTTIEKSSSSNKMNKKTNSSLIEDPYDYDNFNAFNQIDTNEKVATKEKTPNKTPQRKHLIKANDLIADNLLRSPDRSSSAKKHRSFNSSVSELDFDDSPSKSTRSKTKTDSVLEKKQPVRAARNISLLKEKTLLDSSDDDEKSKTKTDSVSEKKQPVKAARNINLLKEKTLLDSSDDDEKSKSKLNDSIENIEASSSDSEQSEKNSRARFQNKKRKEKTRWTERETIYLAVGVELYGKGNWSMILEKLNVNFNNRTSVHLKDKWRNIERYDQVKQYQKRAAVVISKMRDEKK